MNIIFLDIDGVLNCMETFERYQSLIGLDKIMVQRLNRILEATDAKIVLSSTWRNHKNWRRILIDAGIPESRIIGRTPNMPIPFTEMTPEMKSASDLHERGKEIEAYLEVAKVTIFEPIKFCILDDDSDMLPTQKHFKTSFANGLTDKIADSVIAWLNEPQLEVHKEIDEMLT